jgi:hypothetical protein
MDLHCKTVVFSGFRDDKLKDALYDMGCYVVTAVSGNTHILVYKKDGKASKKLDAAKELGIPVMELAEFCVAYELEMPEPRKPLRKKKANTADSGDKTDKTEATDSEPKSDDLDTDEKPAVKKKGARRSKKQPAEAPVADVADSGDKTDKTDATDSDSEPKDANEKPAAKKKAARRSKKEQPAKEEETIDDAIPENVREAAAILDVDPSRLFALVSAYWAKKGVTMKAC